MLSQGEHGLGGLEALPHDQTFYESSHHHRHHHDYLLWAIIIGMLSFVALKLGFKAIKHCHRRHRCSKLPTLASQLSELSSQSDTFPNPLLVNVRTTTAVQAQGGVIPKSEPDWIGNVPWSDWQIDQEDILLCKRPDGRLWELGSGASAKVLHAVTRCAVIWYASCVKPAMFAFQHARLCLFCQKMRSYKPLWHRMFSLFSWRPMSVAPYQCNV